MHNHLKSPPMGWNSWDAYGAAVTEKEFMDNARILSSKLLKYGYDTAVCDIQWYEPTADSNEYHPFADLRMDGFSRLIPAQERFPSAAGGVGFKKIADECHSMGLKFGIHIMRGIPRIAVHLNTAIMGTERKARDIASPFSLCPWNTDMYGINPNAEGAAEYYDSLFRLYAEWGVDFVKCDDIANTELFADNPYSAKKEIELIRRAIDKCKRDMVLSLSPGPAVRSQQSHLSANADMWRISGDFWDDWEKLHEMFSLCRRWQSVSDFGGYPDCDIIPFGKLCVNAPFMGGQGRESRLSPDEQTTLMTLWSIFRSPLFIGAELSSLNEHSLRLLTNADVLDMCRNGHGAKELYRYEVNGEGEAAWSTQTEQAYYLALFNTSRKTLKRSLSKETLPYAEGGVVFDVWKNTEYSLDSGKTEISIPKHAAVLLKFKKSFETEEK